MGGFTRAGRDAVRSYKSGLLAYRRFRLHPFSFISSPGSQKPPRRLAIFTALVILAGVLPLLNPTPALGSFGVTTLVSMNNEGVAGNSTSGTGGVDISSDGRYVAFYSGATNLVSDDTNDKGHVFVRDLSAGTTTRVSVASDGTQGNEGSLWPAISSDGRYVAFTSYATNLAGGAGLLCGSPPSYPCTDIFIHDRTTQTTTRVTKGNGDTDYPTISGDGRYVAFESKATNLVSGDTNNFNDVFVWDRVTETTTLASVSSNEEEGDWNSLLPVISSNGRFVSFTSGACNLVSGQACGDTQVFVRDLVAGETYLVSTSASGAEGNNASGYRSGSSISGDGRYVVFESWANNLVSGDTSAILDIFTKDRQTGAITKVLTSSGQAPNNSSLDASLSQDGRYVVFLSYATNFVPGLSGNWEHVFLHDRENGRTTLIDVATGGQPVGLYFAMEPRVSNNGKRVAFSTPSTNLVSIPNPETDVFVHDVAWNYISRPPEEILGDRASGGYAEDPVNTASGNFTDAETDLDFPDSIFGMDWKRTYNSRDESVSTLGPGWSSGFGSSVTEQESGALLYEDWDGRRITFSPNGTGGYVSPEEFFGDLIKNGDGTFKADFFDGSEENFDSSGVLTSRSNWDGQTVTLSYQSGKLSTVTSTTGYSTTFSYNASERLATATASDGRSVTYSYGANGALSTVTDPSGGATSYESDSQGRVTRILDPDGKLVIENVYDSAGRVTSQTTPSGDVVTFTYNDDTGVTTLGYEGGAQVVYSHDQKGHLTSIKDPYQKVLSKGYNAAGNLTSVTDRRNAQVTQTLDAHGNVTARSEPEGVNQSFVYDSSDRLTSLTDGAGATTTFAYEADERVPSTVTDPMGAIATYTVVDGLVTSMTDPDGVTLTFGYDSFRNHTSTTDEAGKTTTNAYDAEGNMTSTTTPLNLTTSYTYDDAGRVLTATDPTGATVTQTYTDAGRLESTTDSTGATTSYVYNPAGWLFSMTDAEGGVTTYGYDDFGNVTQTVRPGGSTSKTTYDPLGRALSTTDPTDVVLTYEYDFDGNLKKTTDESGAATSRNYDLRGRLTSEIDPLGRGTTYTYTDADQIESVTDPAEGTTSYQYDFAGRQVTQTAADGGLWINKYTAAARLDETIDPNGEITKHNYDALGRLSTVVDPEAGITQHLYDFDGRVTKTVTPAGLETLFDYDGAGRVKEETSASGGLTKNFYTSRGELKKTIDPTGGIQEFTYDGVGRMKTAKDANAGLTQLFYDGRGNLIRRVNAKGGEEIFGYDLADRPTSKTDPLGRQTTMSYNPVGRLAQITDASGKSTRYSYDAAGQVVTQTYGDGSFETFGYDGVGRRTSMVDATGTTAFEYDLVGRSTKVTYPSGKILTSAFDDAGNRTSLTYPDGSAAAFGYDGTNRLSTLSHPAVGSITYGYDPDGRLTAESIPGGTSRSYSFTDGRVMSYSETIGGATRTTSFGYDSADRIVSETTAGATTAYGYDNAGQLIEVAKGSDVTSYGYDQVGNRDSKTRGSLSTAYSYDAAQQLTSAVRSVSGVPTQQAAFTHDAAGRLTLAESLGSSFAIGYDARGFPTKITHVDVVTRTFATQRRYDAEGRLTSAELTSPLGTVSQSSFAWDHVSQVPEIATTSSGGADTNFLYGIGREVAIRSGGFDAFSYDRYGSALSTEDTEDLVRAPSYDEFGVPSPSGATPTLLQEVMSMVGDLSTNHTPLFGYRGEMHLNGLVHLRAREYGAGVGRFTSEDPLDGVEGQVTVANPYPYSANDPLNLVDPFGESPVSDSELAVLGYKVTWCQAGGVWYICVVNAGTSTKPKPKEDTESKGSPPPVPVPPSPDRAQMRVQLQENGPNGRTHPGPRISAPREVGVIVAQVRAGLDVLFETSRDVRWFPFNKHERSFAAAIAKLKLRLDTVRASGGISTVGRVMFEVFPKPQNLYRVDVDNLRGWNLRN